MASLKVLLYLISFLYAVWGGEVGQVGRNRETEEHQVRLIRDLLDTPSFDKRAIPIKGAQHPINVTMRMSLYQLIEVDEPRESVVLSVWMVQTIPIGRILAVQKWQDEYLAWDPAEYGNITWLVLPVEADGIFRVWRPDTTLYNGLEMSNDATEKWICVELSMDMEKNPTKAGVRFAHPAIYRYTCSLDVLYFPFDLQNCTLIFGSWVYDDTYVDYHASEEDVNKEQFVPNEEWTLISFKVYRQGVAFSCCPNLYPQLKYHFVIKRKPLYFICNLLIPIIIITLISFVGFFSPASTERERTEKVSLGLTTLLAMSILLLMVVDQMPKTATFIPIMGWFFILIIILISIAIVLTSYVIAVQRRGRYGHKMTARQRRWMFVILPKWLFMTVPTELAAECADGSEVVNMTEIQYEGTGSQAALLGSKISDSYTSEPGAVGGESANGSATLVGKVDNVRREIHKLNELIKGQNRQEDLPDDWEWMANVLERLFLFTFTIACLVLTGCILLIGWLAEQRKVHL